MTARRWGAALAAAAAAVAATAVVSGAIGPAGTGIALAQAPMGGGPAAAPASGPQDFTVAEVEIDRAGPTGLAARDAAIVEAQRTAFRRLLERLVARDRVAALARANDGQINAMVDHFEVQRERIGPTRYAASFTVAFRPDAVQAWLGRGDAPAAGAAPGGPAAVAPGPGPGLAPAAAGAGAAPAGAGDQRYGVRVPLRTMADLVRIQRQLEGVPGLRRAEQTSLSVGEATFDLVFGGSEQALREALARQDLTLGRDAAGLTLAPRASAAAPR